MPSTFYLAYEGILGNVQEEKFKGSFEISALDFSILQQVMSTNPAEFSELSVLFPDMGAALALFLAEGAFGEGKKLSIVEVNEDGDVITKLNAEGVLISSVQSAVGEGANGVEGAVQVRFDFFKIGIQTSAVSESGMPTPAFSFGYDRGAREPIAFASVGNTSVKPGVGPESDEPVAYYIVIDGVSGNSDVEGVEGWFEIDSYSLGVGRAISNPSGLGQNREASAPLFENLIVISDQFNAALPDLIQIANAGARLDGIRIVGLNAAGDNVFELRGGGAGIASLSYSGDNQTVLDFNLQTIGTRVPGESGNTINFGFDITEQQVAEFNDIPAVTPPEDGLGDPIVRDTSAVTNFYLVSNALNGPETAAVVEDGYLLDDFAFAISNALTEVPSAGAFSMINVSVNDLGLDMPGLLAMSLAGGTPGHPFSIIGRGEIEGVGTTTVFDLTLGFSATRDTIELESSEGAGGGENVRFDFNVFNLHTAANGSLTGNNYGYNQTTETETVAVLAPASVSTSAFFTPEPTAFYMRIPGLSGDVTVPGYEGWFTVSEMAFSSFTTNSAGRNVPSELQVDLNTLTTALPDLYALVAEQEGMVGIDIAGVSATGARVYDLRLRDVQIEALERSEGEGVEPETSLTFSYDVIGLRVDDPTTSAAGGTKTFTYDLTPATPSTPAPAFPAALLGTETAELGGGPQRIMMLLDRHPDGGDSSEITGRSVLDQHEGWFDVLAFNLNLDGLNVTGTPQTMAITVADLGPGLDQLLSFIAAGDPLPQLVLHSIALQDGVKVYQQIIITDAMIQSVNVGDDGGNDQLFISYEDIDIKTAPRDPFSGEFGVLTGIHYDFATNTLAASSAAIVNAEFEPNIVQPATTFFLVIDGYDGGSDSAVDGIEGGFAIDAFDFLAESGDISGLGRVNLAFDDLGTAAPLLMELAALGVELSSISIIGMAIPRDPFTGEPLSNIPVQVSELRLNDVELETLGNTNGADSVSFVGGKVGYETVVILPPSMARPSGPTLQEPGDGTSSVAFDIATGQEIAFSSLSEPQPAGATGLIVTTLDDVIADDGLLSLREAVDLANAEAEGSFISFDESLFGGTIVLGAELLLESDISISGDIDGDGRADISVSGGDMTNIFFVFGTGTQVTLRSLTLTDGFSTSVGGAIEAATGTVLTVINSTVQNSSSGQGGGIAVFGSLLLVNSLVTGNSATFGGGIFNDGDVVVINSAIDTNTATQDGGGMFVQNASTAEFYNSNVVFNTAGGRGGGIFADGFAPNGDPSPSDLLLVNSVVGENFSGLGDGIFDNLFTEVAITVINSSVGNENGLGALQDNGGPVLSRGLLANSVLIDEGSNAALLLDTLDLDGDGDTSELLPIDITGGPRVTNGTVDIGTNESAEIITADADGAFLLGNFFDSVLNGGVGSDVLFGDHGPFLVSATGNSSFETAQNLDDGLDHWTTAFNPLFADSSIPHTTVVINGEEGTQEFFSIFIAAGETITLDVDYGIGDFGGGSIDTMLQLFDPGNVEVAANDDAANSAGGLGSAGNPERDSFLTFTATTSGIYTIVVREYFEEGLEAPDTLLLNVSLTNHAVAPVRSVGDNFLNGGGGDDQIFAGAGNDLVEGGAGADAIFAGFNSTISYAGSSAGVVLDYNNRVFTGGDAEGDTLTNNPLGFIGSAFNDRLVVSNIAGADFNGGNGTDTLDFSQGEFTAYWDLALGLVGTSSFGPEAGSDRLTSVENFIGTSLFTNHVRGTAGVNVLTGGALNDELFGLGGNDVLMGGAGNDRLDGGANFDTASYASATSFVRVTLGVPGVVQNTRGAGFDTLVGIERLIGSGFDDMLFGNESNNRIDGGSGLDQLAGGGGNDVLFGDGGDDSINGGIGNDTMHGGLGNDAFFVDSLGDIVTEALNEGTADIVRSSVDFTLGANIERLLLTGAARIGIGNEIGNTIFGAGGGDTLTGLGGGDVLRGNGGRDTINGGTGLDLIDGGGDKDTLTGGADRDMFQFRDGDTVGSRSLADIITDFDQVLEERIQLALVDASSLTAGNQNFEWIGTAAFSNLAGQLRYQQGNGVTFIEGDLNGDGTSDYTIRLNGLYLLDATDFTGVNDVFP